MNTLAPISGQERLQILDILRGFAIFGILAVNIGGFASPIFFPGYLAPDGSAFDELAHRLMLFFAEGKFYTIFSFLFGLGFSVQLGRAENKGRDIKSFYPRRLWVLFGFGILHAIFFWYGDILRLYALLGFALLAFRNRSNRTLLIWAGIFYAAAFVTLALIGGPSASDPIPGFDVVAMARQAYHGSSFLNVLVFQVLTFPVTVAAIALAQGLSVMSLFLLGLFAGRIRFFEHLQENRVWLVRAAIVGLMVGVPANALFMLTENSIPASFGFVIGSPAFAAMYISLIGLFSLTEFGRKTLAPLSYVGRMALTNYILQSVVCSLLFFGYGFGLYEQIGAAGLWGITFLIYLVQIPFSMAWLSRFHFGPLEWIWRTLTYRQPQPFVR
jgi:uncharacterized protein